MPNRIAEDVRSLPPSGIRRFFDIAADMEDVISLGIGEPDFPTPAHVARAGADSLLQGGTGYTANAGMPELRHAISDYVDELYGLTYDPDEEILVTVGVSEGLFLALRALLNPGDEVLVVEPCFVSNPAAVSIAGGVCVPVSTEVAQDFQVTAAALERRITPRTRAIVINYPNNPTGAVLTDEHLMQVAAVAQAHDLVVISDEIYERLVFGHRHRCFASLPGMRERTVLLSGMSKSFAMTGWRIGYACGPPDLLAAMGRLHQYLTMAAPTMGQVASLQALQQGSTDVEAMRLEYDRRRRLVVDGFNALGLPCFEPRGAFYAFPDVRSSGLDDEAFSERLLFEERVALVPGSAFGASGAGFVRASYATGHEQLEEALLRIQKFLQRL
ncbi:MAG: aminotransferase class I/II-fold pyridoxal phosphate-dependent enzyme [Anaerolineaceae bacterium]|nr:aminotransferase class I/II-fold pyridoxal phosphate-dependent enzyme [Anaerolineaceae bacterium]